MDKVAQAAATANTEAIKEPRGFIKLIQVIIAIFAFATTTSVSTSSSFTVNCGESSTQTIQYSFGYPFRLNQVSVGNIPFCNGTGGDEIFLHGNYGSAAEFYVFVGVMAFLYSLAAIILYVFFDEKYRKFETIPIADFVISCVFTLLWLISSSAWADGVRHVKYYTNPEQLWIDTIPECKADGVCEVVSTGNFASLNVSLIFGFLNMAVWGANLWFLFKETRWHKVQTEHPEMTPQEQPQKF